LARVQSAGLFLPIANERIAIMENKFGPAIRVDYLRSCSAALEHPITVDPWTKRFDWGDLAVDHWIIVQ
jgi:hypothetical protein